MQGHQAGIRLIEFSSRGDLMATACIDHRFMLWRGGEPQIGATFKSSLAKANIDRIRSIAFSPNDQRIALAVGEQVLVLDSHDLSEVFRYQADSTWAFIVTSPYAVAFRPNGKLMASFDSGIFAEWTPTENTPHVWYDNSAPREMAVLPDGETLAGTDSFSMSLWDLSLKTCIAKHAVDERIYAFKTLRNSSIAILRTLEDFCAWDLTKGKLLARVRTGTGFPAIAGCSRSRLVAFSDEEGIHLLDLSGRPVAILEAEFRYVLSLAFDPLKRALHAGCADGTLMRWSLETLV